MVKIQILALNTHFIEIVYNDLATTFGCANRVLNKESVDINLTAGKDKIIIAFSGTTFVITIETLAYINTTAATVEAYYNELKTLL